MSSRNDTEEIVAKWLQVCPPCDAGIGAPCTHPDEDYRPVIMVLLNQRDGARTALGEAIDESRRLRDQLRYADQALARRGHRRDGDDPDWYLEQRAEDGLWHRMGDAADVQS